MTLDMTVDRSDRVVRTTGLAALVFLPVLLMGSVCSGGEEHSPKGGEATYMGMTSHLWERALHSSEPDRSEAWGRLVRGKRAAVPILGALLASEDGRIRQDALQAVVFLGQSASPLAPTVFDGIKDNRLQFVPDGGLLAVEALDRMGAVSNGYLFDLYASKSSWAVSTAAGEALFRRRGFLADRLSELRKILLDSEDSMEQTGSACLLCRAGPKGIKFLDDTLKGPDLALRLLVLEGLTRAGEVEGLAALSDTVIDLARSKDPELRSTATYVIPQVVPERSRAQAILGGFLDDDDLGVRLTAVHALLSLGYAGWKPGEPERTICESLADRREGMRDFAAETALLLEHASTKLIAPLVECASASSLSLRLASWKGLAKFGPGSEDRARALGALVEGFGRGGEEIWATGRAIAAFGADGAEFLSEVVDKRKSPVARRYAARLLGEIGADAVGAVPVLRIGMKEEDELLRIDSALALWRVTGETDATLAVLVKGAESSREVVRIKALGALVAMGPAAAPAVPRLKQRMKNDASLDASWLSLLVISQSRTPELAMAKGVIQRLQNEFLFLRTKHLSEVKAIGPRLRHLHPILLELLDSADWRTRDWSARALAGIGLSTPEVLLELERAATKDPDPDVRSAAAAALRSLPE